MIFSKSSSFRYRLFLFISLILSLIFLSIQLKNIDVELTLYGDYVQYWSAGKLLIQGKNPYAWENVKEIKNSIGYVNLIDETTPSMFLYPPWALPITLLPALLSYPSSRFIWLLLNIIIVFTSINILNRLLNFSKINQWLSYVIGFSFSPVLFLLGVGHFTSIILLGITLFIYFNRNRSNITWTTDFLAGISFALIMFKPNVLFLVILYLLLWTIMKKRWFILVGCVTFLLLLIFISSLFYPSLVNQYYEVISNYSPDLWKPPTLGMILRNLLGNEKFWLSYLPPSIGITWLIYFWVKKRNSDRWFYDISIVILVSYVCSPYVWTYDMVAMLIPILYIFKRTIYPNLKPLKGMLFLIYLLINFSMLYLHLYLDDYWFFWFAPVLLIWFLIAERVTQITDEKDLLRNDAIKAFS